MIWDSGPWRVELCRLAARIEQRTRQKRWQEASSARLEQDVFFAAYAVRKLLEAKKLSTSITDTVVVVKTYPRTSTQMDHMNWHHLGTHFDFERPTHGELRVGELCNQFIHSYVFSEWFEGEPARLSGLLFTSDRKRKSVLYHVQIAELVRLLRRIGDDSPDNAVRIRDPATWEWIVYAWDSRYEAPDQSKLDAIERLKPAVAEAFRKRTLEKS
jgi:hypothetical protein